MMHFTAMKYEPLVVTIANYQMWQSYVVYPNPKLKLVEKKK